MKSGAARKGWPPAGELGGIRNFVGKMPANRAVPREIPSAVKIMDSVPHGERQLLKGCFDVWSRVYDCLDASLGIYLNCGSVSFFQRENIGLQISDMFIGPFDFNRASIKGVVVMAIPLLSFALMNVRRVFEYAIEVVFRLLCLLRSNEAKLGILQNKDLSAIHEAGIQIHSVIVFGDDQLERGCFGRTHHLKRIVIVVNVDIPLAKLNLRTVDDQHWLSVSAVQRGFH